MAQPQGFRTFQILLAIGFLAGFFVVLLVFFWKISDLNMDLNRISIATDAKGKIARILRDGRACELNFSGLAIGHVPISLRKIINLRKEALIRVDQSVGSSNIFLNSLRIVPDHPEETIGRDHTNFFLEMVFSDRKTSAKSPIKLLVDAKGEFNNHSEFTVASCHLSFNDSGD